MSAFARGAVAAAFVVLLSPASDSPVYFAREVEGIGDPNPFYEDGVYSVFYLKNEGRHPWWMSQSQNLSRWSPPVETVAVGALGTPDHWTGSGSVIADPAGGYRLYYTGHAPDRRPKEVVMEARSAHLRGPWQKHALGTFGGSPYYDALDFRDPFVFWNDEAKAWWMLMTTRRQGRAAIGLLTSPDLNRWSAAPPLYTEESPLNLEVPDLFTEGGDWFLLYSDQRDAARQVRYLRAGNSRGPYRYGPYDSLDGRAFYAGKSAGTGNDRLLFGWLAHRKGKRDDGAFIWGGDMIVHAIRRTADGQIAVALPDSIAARFTETQTKLSPDNLLIGELKHPTLVSVAASQANDTRISFDFHGRGDNAAQLMIDTSSGNAKFRFGKVAETVDIDFPLDIEGKYRFELLIEPDQGLGILYINRFRALSFRYYAVGNTRSSIVLHSGPPRLIGTVSFIKH